MTPLIQYLKADQHFETLLSQYAWSIEATELIQSLFPSSYANQFRAVLLQQQQAILFARDGAIAHFLKLNKKKIIILLNKWQVKDVLVRVHL